MMRLVLRKISFSRKYILLIVVLVLLAFISVMYQDVSKRNVHVFHTVATVKHFKYPVQGNRVKITRKELERSAEELQIKKLLDEGLRWNKLSVTEKILNLLENPIYSKFDIKKPVNAKKAVNLLLIVSSGPRRSDRRNAIRETWWKQCKPTFGVTIDCVFFTDLLNDTHDYYHQITQENELHKDMKFQLLKGGIEFGVRFLYHLVWAMTHYNFDYFVRVDDDYFLCLERLLYELPQPMQKQFHWGYTHCILELVRPEESLILLSHDIVETFLSQNPNKMRCHPWADQMMAVWTNDLQILLLYRHDERIHHAPIVDQAPELRKDTSICSNYMGIHGTYMNDMRLFWRHRGHLPSNMTSVAQRDKLLGNLMTNTEECDIVHYFNYLKFEPEWQYEPKLCLFDPVWDTGKQAVVGGVYSGRQDDKRLAIQDLKRKNKNRIDDQG